MQCNHINKDSQQLNLLRFDCFRWRHYTVYCTSLFYCCSCSCYCACNDSICNSTIMEICFLLPPLLLFLNYHPEWYECVCVCNRPNTVQFTAQKELRFIWWPIVPIACSKHTIVMCIYATHKHVGRLAFCSNTCVMGNFFSIFMTIRQQSVWKSYLFLWCCHRWWCRQCPRRIWTV